MQRRRCCNHAVPATALERNLHIERWESKPKTKRQSKNNQSRPLLNPKTNTPFVHFAPTQKPDPHPRGGPADPKSTKNCRFTRTSQVARKSSIVQHTEESSSVVSNTLRGLVCCGSVLVCPCCRHGRWSCARWSCPRYCVGWARIACQR